MSNAQIRHMIRHASGEQLLLLAIEAGPGVKVAIDRELDRRAVGDVVRTAIGSDRRQAA